MSLSFRDLELLLDERGIVVSYESFRRWCLKFGCHFAGRTRQWRPGSGDKRCLDEVFIRIQGKLRYPRRAVVQNGIVLHILVQSRRDGSAAKRFFERLLKDRLYTPRVVVTDKLKSHGVAKRECYLTSSIKEAVI
ncbi:IS6 family transposase (plasmid) [Lichenicola cladoniae]|uniref:IS6 family transposase n=1 Tax=Lichenicola cladoniae TaxID=1484109 RepID=A0A6M8HZ57_9PROT|nr:DDE-type integrase/transposase/recombinase [Lichenicola cladoniae]NPD67659.1 IS6 family transposase [Acetobacteraceae bacterium]QKE93819.1 IS6 family transposase [Lichenicola cladoniae]